MSERSFFFRAVQEADLPVLCTFPQSPQEQFFMFPRSTYPLTPAQLQVAIDQRKESTVILAQGKVAGFANFYICLPGEKCAIGDVIISPGLRRQGVGRALISEMLRLAFEKYVAETVEISCFNTNTAGLLFYPKLGFIPISLEERVDWNGEKLVAIHLELTREAWEKRRADQSASSV